MANKTAISQTISDLKLCATAIKVMKSVDTVKLMNRNLVELDRLIKMAQESAKVAQEDQALLVNMLAVRASGDEETVIS